MGHSNVCYVIVQPFVVALSGSGLEWMLSLAYVVGGALLGSPAGGEFLSAKDAAAQVPLPSCSLAMLALACKTCCREDQFSTLNVGHSSHYTGL